MQQPRGAKSSPACAACKYQRRKCGPNCPLAEHFPAHLYKDFLHAHRLFGVSNIVKMTANLNPQDKKIAMNSIVYQANARASDPVGGCFRIICNLRNELELAERQLQMVRAQIELRKAQLAIKSEGMAAIGDDLVMFDGGVGRTTVIPVEVRAQGLGFLGDGDNRLGDLRQKGIVREENGFSGRNRRVYEVFDEMPVKAENGESSSASSGRLQRGFPDDCLGDLRRRLN